MAGGIVRDGGGGGSNKTDGIGTGSNCIGGIDIINGTSNCLFAFNGTSNDWIGFEMEMSLFFIVDLEHFCIGIDFRRDIERERHDDVELDDVDDDDGER